MMTMTTTTTLAEKLIWNRRRRKHRQWASAGDAVLIQYLTPKPSDETWPLPPLPGEPIVFHEDDYELFPQAQEYGLVPGPVSTADGDDDTAAPRAPTAPRDRLNALRLEASALRRRLRELQTRWIRAEEQELARELADLPPDERNEDMLRSAEVLEPFLQRQLREVEVRVRRLESGVWRSSPLQEDDPPEAKDPDDFHVLNVRPWLRDPDSSPLTHELLALRKEDVRYDEHLGGNDAKESPNPPEDNSETVAHGIEGTERAVPCQKFDETARKEHGWALFANVVVWGFACIAVNQLRLFMGFQTMCQLWRTALAWLYGHCDRD